uniref:Fe2OG dioxygenase domain-containing protein n=1 Tax=Steinernema glaseri TaxID=37863 RepID=A0A1I7Z0I8_9BILA
MRFVVGGFLFLVIFGGARAEDEEDIGEMWSRDLLNMCDNPSEYFSLGQLASFHYWRGADVVRVEIRSLTPLLLRFVGFASGRVSKRLLELAGEQALERMNVTSENTSYRHRGRRADGLWLEHESDTTLELFKKIGRVFRFEPKTAENFLHESDPTLELFKKIGRVFRFDPKTAENFLLLKYDENGHYAPHYDHLDETTQKDWWTTHHGNRLATMLLIAKTAERGGGTVFPYLGVTVQPEEGDLVMWFNADSHEAREVHSIHGACPIREGTKVALSLWLRSFPHATLRSPLHGEDPSYRLDHVLRFV